MKTFRKLALAVVGTMALSAAFSSCSTDDDNDYLRTMPNALVTVKTAGDACYFQLDDSTTLLPSNVKSLYGGKEVRALVNYTKTDQKAEKYDAVVNVNWIDSILTKKPVPSLATSAENDAKYGNDAVDIVRSWVTIAEDGYLTLRFRALWGNVKQHTINLVANVNPENPYEVELRHNTNGDPQLRWGDGLVAFNLNGVLPDTQGKKVKLAIKWKSTAGDKTVDFDYCSRKAITSSAMLSGFDASGRNAVK